MKITGGITVIVGVILLVVYAATHSSKHHEQVNVVSENHAKFSSYFAEQSHIIDIHHFYNEETKRYECGVFDFEDYVVHDHYDLISIYDVSNDDVSNGDVSEKTFKRITDIKRK